MTGQRRLSKSLTAFDKIKQNIVKEIPGILGNTFKGQTLVEVPNRAGFVYVRLRSNMNEVIQAFNENVSPVYDLPVIIIRDLVNNRYYVKGRDIGQYSTWGSGSSYLPRHGAQHSFPDTNWGGDIVWVYDRQFVPLGVSPATGTASGYVHVNPDVYYWNGEWIYAGNVNTPNLLSYNATGTGARLVLIYLDVDGDVQVVGGNEFDQINYSLSQIIPYLPDLPGDGVVPLGAVRLLSGTTSISWNEIFDLRPIIAGNDYPSPYLVQDEGVTLTRRSYMNFKGAVVTAIDNPGDDSTDITISGATGTAQGHIIQDEGSSKTARSKLNFVGNAVVATDDAVNDATKVTISFTSGSFSGSPGYFPIFTPDGGWIQNSILYQQGLGIFTDDPLYTGYLGVRGTLSVRENVNISGSATVLQDLDVSGDSSILGDLDIEGSISIGSIVASPSAGEIYLENDARIGGGLQVGGLGVNPGIGNIGYTGALQPLRSGTSYNAYTYIPIDDPILSSSFAGTGTTAIGTYTVDLEDEFGISPQGGFIKSVVLAVKGKYLSPDELDMVFFGKNISVLEESRIEAIRAQNTYTQQIQIIVPTDTNGHFGMIVVGQDVTNFKLQLCGYFL